MAPGDTGFWKGGSLTSSYLGLGSSSGGSGIVFDRSDFVRLTAKLGGAADQMPFALANAMSRAAFVLRDVFVDDLWPTHVHQRNKRFLSAALRVDKATKKKLSVAVFDSMGRGHLLLHARSGTKNAKKRLAIPPTGSVKRTAKGIPKGQKPRALIDTTPKRALRILPHGIFVGRKGRLHLAYAFRPSAHQDADVPFDAVWDRVFRAQARKEFPRALALAMQTRRASSKYERELLKGRRLVKMGGAHGNSLMSRGSMVKL